MAAEEDGDVFEITDFTTASDWERFIARLEEVLHEWKLVNRDPLPNAVKGKFTEGPWEEKSEEIQFADFKFLITYTRLKPSGQAEAESRSSREREDAEDDRQEDEHRTPTVLHDIISTDNDFPSRAHCLCRWYGMQEFVVIQPAPNFGIIDTESRAMILQSSASIALSNSSCHVPVFVQLQQKWRKLYSGCAVVPGANVQFEMCHLKKLPSKFQHLDGLLDMFKGKLGCEYISMPPVSVSVRFTYILEDWIYCPWPQQPPDFSSFSEGEVGCSELDVLPFGACEDPVSELHLSCTWPYLSADMIVETSGYSDLDPLQAPQWSVRIQMTEDPQCLLGQYLRAFMELCGRTETTDEILGRVLVEGAESPEKEGASEDITNALQRLTEPNLPYHIPSLGSVVSRATSRLKIKPEEAPIPPRLLNKILVHLFPDATGLSGSPKKSDKGQNSQSRESTPLEETPPQGCPDRAEEVYNEALKQLKSCSPDSLTYRLAVSFAIINHNHGGLRAIAHLWQEFVLEMRYRWENGILIPGLGASTDKSPPPLFSSSPTLTPTPSPQHGTGTPAPNLGSCLLHQKLQMLNCCIEHKIRREAAGYGQEGTLHHEASSSAFETDATDSCPDNDLAEGRQGVGSMVSSSNEEEEEEEEFFECEEEVEEEVDGEKEVGDKSRSVEASPKHSVVSASGKRYLPSEKSVDSSVSDASFKDAKAVVKAEGRLAPMKNMRSLSTGEPLFVPVTQEPSPMTEDMLEEQAEVLAKLGSSPQGSQLRARMQSACLLSDMESFKAANPGCCLEDFVRWYSPRDYIEEEEEEGEEDNAGNVPTNTQQKKSDRTADRDEMLRKQPPEKSQHSGTGSTTAMAPTEGAQMEPDKAEAGLKPSSLQAASNSQKGASNSETSVAVEPSDPEEKEEDMPRPAQTGSQSGDVRTPSHTEDQSSWQETDQDGSDPVQDKIPDKEGSVASEGEISSGSSGLKMPSSPLQGAPCLLSSSLPKSSSSLSSPLCRVVSQRRGCLSQRMQIPGNMWVEVWQNARHMPARRQKRLFDDTKEAEKVLHFLSGLRPGELVLHLLPMLIHASVLKLAEKEDPDVPVLRTLTDQVLAKAVKVTRGPQPPETKRYEDVVRMIELAETVSSRALSLKTKFTKDLLEKGKAEEELHNFVSSILQHPEVDVRGGAYGPAGNVIHKLFSAAQKAALMILEEEEEEGGKEETSKEKAVTAALNEHIMKPASTIHDFPPPSAREYILRAMIPRPAPYSRVLPQRMYCVIVDGDYRLAGAFCSDTTFQ